MPCPAISGADPWIGSYNPEHRLPFSGAPANEAEGRRPKEPGMTLLSSDKLIERASQCRLVMPVPEDLHVPEHILCQNYAVQLSRVSDHKHGSRIYEVMVKRYIGKFPLQRLCNDLPPQS